MHTIEPRSADINATLETYSLVGIVEVVMMIVTNEPLIGP
jgi:hypothetical protein